MVKVGAYNVEYTRTKVIVYLGDRRVGSAGVRDPKDFDFEMLVRLAKHQPKDLSSGL